MSHPTLLCHPERSASPIYRIYREFYGAKSKDPGDACWPMLFGAFRPQTTREIKKSQPPSEAEGSAVLFTSICRRGEPPHPPLSSRAKPRDLRFSPPAFVAEVSHPTPPLSSRAKPRDLRFSSPAFVAEVSHPTPPLSSRAKPRDLRFSPSTFVSEVSHHTPLCHPERSRGTCGSPHQHLSPR